MADLPKKKKFDVGLLTKVLRLAKPYKGTLFFTAALACILAPLAVMRPFLIEKMVDQHIMTNDVAGMKMMLMAIFGVLILEVILRYFFLYHADWMGQAVIRDLRTRTFNHINSLNLRYFDRTPVGQSTTRTINDVAPRWLSVAMPMAAPRWFARSPPSSRHRSG